MRDVQGSVEVTKNRVKMFTALYENMLLLRSPFIDFLSISLIPLFQKNWWKKAIVNAFEAKDQDTIYQREGKEKKQASLLKGNVGVFDVIDFLDLFEILQHNWNILEKNNSNVFNQKFLSLVFKLRIIRNDIAHPTPVKLSNEKFKQYMRYLHEFSVLIGADKKMSANLAKYNYEPSHEEITEDAIKRRRLIDLLVEEVLNPATNCASLSDDIKESIIRTIIRFETASSLKEVDDFFNGSLVSPRGEIIHRELSKQKLKSFEDIRGKYRTIFES